MSVGEISCRGGANQMHARQEERLLNSFVNSRVTNISRSTWTNLVGCWRGKKRRPAKKERSLKKRRKRTEVTISFYNQENTSSQRSCTSMPGMLPLEGSLLARRTRRLRPLVLKTCARRTANNFGTANQRRSFPRNPSASGLQSRRIEMQARSIARFLPRAHSLIGRL